MNNITNIVVKHYSGSIAYGTNVESSDIDIRGVYVVDPIVIRTPFNGINQECYTNTSNGNDVVLFELNKFMVLLSKSNPAAVESLWIEEDSILESSEPYWQIRKYKEGLITPKFCYATLGMANQTLKRMARWGDPTFKLGLKEDMHSVRLLNMSLELLTKGKIIVKRPESDWLKKIRNGEISYSVFERYISSKIREVEDLLYSQSTLIPKEFDCGLATKLILDTQKHFWGY